MKIAYFSATQKTSYKDTILYKSYEELGMDEQNFFIKTNNKDPLAKVYNSAKSVFLDGDFDCIVLVHDDVHLQHDPKVQLKRLFNQYDVVGVAGCSKASIKSPALWHIMGGGFGSGTLHGAVAHGIVENQQMTAFGQYPHRVLMIDGVFMAISRKVAENVDFDEECPSDFHFYDLNYSYLAHLKGYKVGVGDIGIIHASPGLREYTDEWKSGNEYFIKKFGK